MYIYTYHYLHTEYNYQPVYSVLPFKTRVRYALVPLNSGISPPADLYPGEIHPKNDKRFEIRGEATWSQWNLYMSIRQD